MDIIDLKYVRSIRLNLKQKKLILKIEKKRKSGLLKISLQDVI